MAVRTALREWAVNTNRRLQRPETSWKRNRRILNVAIKYAIRRRILPTNPLPKGVDKRSLLNPEQAAAILDWIRRRPRGGKRLHAFFATLYYCGPRPEEAVAMRVEDVTLPEPDARTSGASC
ncbi:hypothetical protein [Streptomyces sp. NPDC049915]|uniref:hypothetical protein n=1 Tax=Streptomyces sp. NPDC049915 TaxID=3155510 RepID=UPI00343ADABD